jgi:hypothetical protein
MLTVPTALPEHPLEVPVTVYEVVLAGETEIEEEFSPELHEYESAPEAVNVAFPPEQIVGEFTSTVNDGTMLTVATALPEHSLEVPVTVYEVVLVGETETEEEFSPELHEYESAPEAVKVAFPPEQIVGEFTSTVNDGLIETIPTALPEHPLEVPVTVYEVVLAGETKTEEEFSPELHKYESAPEAVNVAFPPEQIVGELTSTANDDPMLTIATAVSEHPLEVPVTVYEVVELGETETEEEFSPELHEYESAPEAVNVAVPPEQIVGELTSTANDGPMLTIATAVSEHPLEVPVTVYEVVLVGETEMEEEFSPVFHE